MRGLKAGAWGLAALLAGGLWLFPDAVSRWRRARSNHVRMDPSCRLARGPCAVRFSDGAEVQLSIAPPGAPAATPLRFRVEADGVGPPRAVEVQGVDMNMGFFRFALQRDGAGWSARGVVPVCTRERMAWRADVVFEDRVAGFRFWSRAP
ncbi:MAG TPA: hypothetical protein RMG48_00505 [Myxococcales bacterium LLY-WYZ-16_1]|nr:hypothetical protein [Myxococcales bacterium LLY-WYZ-16_1]